MAKSTDPKDPRFKRFRTAAYGVYVVIVTVFSLLICYSVFKSIVAMSPPRVVDGQQVLSPSECVSGADRLWRKLEDERKAFSDTPPAEKVDERFTRFRGEWIRQFRELEGRCALDSKSRESLRELFKRLDSVLDLYVTHAVQYAGEVGPEVDRLTAAFEKAKQEAAGK